MHSLLHIDLARELQGSRLDDRDPAPTGQGGSARVGLVIRLLAMTAALAFVIAAGELWLAPVLLVFAPPLLGWYPGEERMRRVLAVHRESKPAGQPAVSRSDAARRRQRRLAGSHPYPAP